MDGGTKGPRRTRRDGAHAQVRAGTSKLRRSYTLSRECVRRIEADALGRGCTPAEVVERLAIDHCRRFVLTDRGPGAGAGPVPQPPEAAEPAGRGGRGGDGSGPGPAGGTPAGVD